MELRHIEIVFFFIKVCANYNRTNMELRRQSQELLPDSLCPRVLQSNQYGIETPRTQDGHHSQEWNYNRTNMELRPLESAPQRGQIRWHYNRTNMELRHTRRPPFAGMEPSFITIEPIWNWDFCRLLRIHTCCPHITIEPIWNWDDDILRINNYINQYITIEPIWNWDPVIKILFNRKPIDYNRTNMELRLPRPFGM